METCVWFFNCNIMLICTTYAFTIDDRGGAIGFMCAYISALAVLANKSLRGGTK